MLLRMVYKYKAPGDFRSMGHKKTDLVFMVYVYLYYRTQEIHNCVQTLVEDLFSLQCKMWATAFLTDISILTG